MDLSYLRAFFLLSDVGSFSFSFSRSFSFASRIRLAVPVLYDDEDEMGLYGTSR